jgi:acetyltransferase-like isoleucine patch superfamily enzyme
MNQSPFRYDRLRRIATAIRSRIKLDLLNPWVRYGHDVHCAFSVEFFSPHRRIVLGDHVRIGPRAYLMCDLTIGNWVLIARSAAFAGRDDHDFKTVGVPKYAAPRGAKFHTVVVDDVWIGHSAVILSGVTIGRGSIVAASAVVTHSVPAYSIAAGVPARVVGRRFTPDQIYAHEEKIGYQRKITARECFEPPPLRTYEDLVQEEELLRKY